MTKTYIVYEQSTGRIVSAGACDDEMLDAQAFASGLAVIEHQPVDIFACRVDTATREVVSLPYRPSDIATFNYVTMQWEIDTEQLWASVRSKRNALLTACDWTQLPDAPASKRKAWATYRQTLRDITLQTDPFNITWPVAPV